ncbi:hypothetical protein P7C70_g6738, partial [Phenoliferia sp. Uapishka_3]
MSSACSSTPSKASSILPAAPGLGPGGHAFESHLPTIHNSRNLSNRSQSVYARCRDCKWTSSQFATAAAATRQWRNRHAARHGILSFDLALFHPSLPPNTVPAGVPREEGIGLVYFANRLRARQIFDYAALVGMSRYHARSHARLTQGRRLANASWNSSIIPADEVALLYRRTRFTESVMGYADPFASTQSSADFFDVNCFAGVSLTGLNAEDRLLEAVGFDYDPVSLGSAFWFWIYGVRTRFFARVEEGTLDGADEAWEDYRQRLYQGVSDYAAHLMLPQQLASECVIFDLLQPELPSTDPPIMDLSLWQVSAIPYPFTSQSAASNKEHPLYGHDSFLLEVSAIIVALLNTDTRSATGADHFNSTRWLAILGNGGQEVETWQHMSWAREEALEKKAWPRVIAAWDSLPASERAIWCTRQDPGRLARRDRKVMEARAVEDAARVKPAFRVSRYVPKRLPDGKNGRPVKKPLNAP